MAKKGQALQLQAELNTDEEWEKYIQKPGLLVIDVYSDWCGPCAGMQATLKKIKVEIGGDTLQLAIAKCDGITALERFRGTSEPTWMLIAGGKMVNFMYGANAPKLTRLITEELRLQKMVEAGTYTRTGYMEVTHRAPEEAARWEKSQAIIAKELELEAAKTAQEIHQRLLKESDAILENLGNLGIIVILPHARDKYMDVLKEVMNEAGLVISISEKMKITSEQIEGLSYFLERDQNMYLPESSLEHMYAGDSQVLLIKASHGTTDMEDPVSVRILEAIYGLKKHPPGEEGCPYRRLVKFPTREVLVSESIRTLESVADVETASKQGDLMRTGSSRVEQVASKEKIVFDNEDDLFIIGLWAPPTRRILSSCFKILFPRMAAPILIPEPPPKPPYIVVCFPIDRRSKVQNMMTEWESDIMRYGIFSSCVAEEAQLIAKSYKKFDKSDIQKTNNEKIVIQLARKRSECLLAFASEVPIYMSPNVGEGKRECKFFFPEDYDEPPEKEIEEEEGEEEGEELDDLKSESLHDEEVLDDMESFAEVSQENIGEPPIVGEPQVIEEPLVEEPPLDGLIIEELPMEENAEIKVVQEEVVAEADPLIQE